MDHVPEVKTILHKREHDLVFNPDPNLALLQGDILVVEGLLENLRRLSKYFLP